MNIKNFAVVALACMLAVSCGKKEEAAPAKPAAPTPASVASLPAPATGDEAGWKSYLKTVVKANMEGIRSSPFVYYVPSVETENFQEQYDRQLDNVSAAIARGVLPGNMLAFGSPESAKLADLVVEAFKGSQAGSMKGVRVLFIGKKEDQERVKAAVEPTSADVVFHSVD
jgi:hypothetical protein